MCYKRHGLLCWVRANKGKIYEINRLIKRAIRCIHFNNWKENASKIKITKKVLVIKSMFKYDLGIFMHKFKMYMFQKKIQKQTIFTQSK